MKIKRGSTLLLSLILFLGGTGCFGSNTSNSSNNRPTQNSSVYSSQGSESEEENENSNEMDTDNKLTGSLTAAMAYSEGLAFVSQADPLTITVGFNNYFLRPLNICIDEQGKEVFRLGEKAICRAGFTNGNAFVTIDGQDCLVNKQGEIVVSPEKTGYTKSMYRDAAYDKTFYKQIYYDGYFPVYHKIVSFSGEVVHQYGVLGTDGTWKLELSDEYFNGQEITAYQAIEQYGNGFLKIGNKWWNLKTGEVTTGTPDFGEDYLFTSIYSYRSAFMEKYPTITEMGNFLSNAPYTYVKFYNGGTYFFSLIGRDKELLFEPFEITNTTGMDERAGIIYTVKKDGTLLFYSVDGTLKGEIPAFMPADSTVLGIELEVCLGEEMYLIKEELSAASTGGRYYPMNNYFINGQGEVVLGNK